MTEKSSRILGHVLMSGALHVFQHHLRRHAGPNCFKVCLSAKIGRQCHLNVRLGLSAFLQLKHLKGEARCYVQDVRRGVRGRMRNSKDAMQPSGNLVGSKVRPLRGA